MLKARFDNKRWIFQGYIAALFSLSLLNSVLKHLRALKALPTQIRIRILHANANDWRRLESTCAPLRVLRIRVRNPYSRLCRKGLSGCTSTSSRLQSFAFACKIRIRICVGRALQCSREQKYNGSCGHFRRRLRPSLHDAENCFHLHVSKSCKLFF